MSELCLIANIVAVHGIDGGLKLRSHSDIPGRFSRLDTVLVGHDELTARKIRVLEASEHGDRVILYFDGCTDRNMAENFVGMNVFITDEQMEIPPDGRYFVHDLIGCRVATPDGEARGEIVDVMLMPANDVYVVQFEGREVLVPAVPDFIGSVDLQAKLVTVKPIPGLFEEEDEN